MTPENEIGRPRGTTLETGSTISDAANVHPASIVGGTTGTRPASIKWRRGTRKPRPIASASLYSPVPGRGMYWLSIRCPYCHGTHLGRVREEHQAAGNRRVSCGPVQVVVRRVYRPADSEAAA